MSAIWVRNVTIVTAISSNVVLIRRRLAAIVRVLCLAILVVGAPWGAWAAEPGGEEAQAPQTNLPPADSPPLVQNIELRFPAQGNVSSVDGNTYLYYMELKNHTSSSIQNKWVPYDETIEQIAVGDHARLWDTGFLTDLWIEVVDDQGWPNGVEGKRIVFNLEERERVRIVTFEGSEKLDRGDIETALTETNNIIRSDSFLDEGRIGRVKTILGQMFAEKGYEFAEITHDVQPVSSLGNQKVVELTFNMTEGPKVHVQKIDFVGNVAMDDGELKGKMKNTKERYWLSFITKRGTYKSNMFEQDADAVVAHYRDNGYIEAQVGQPELEYLEASEDGKNRGINLRIPIEEGERYRIGKVEYDGATVLTESGLISIFEGLIPGEFYAESEIRQSLETAREVYGQLGYYEMTGFPDLQPRTGRFADTEDNGNGNGGGGENGNGNGDGNGAGTHDEEADEEWVERIDGSPIVDITVRIQEGDQYFINRINFKGNKTTHDEVIRREIQLLENGVFNTQALQYSVRRLNQLGYFEPFEETEVDVQQIEGSENQVDLTFDLTETNLNQLTFGAGISQFDGFFGQLSFQTTNFMGRGETFSIGLQSGSRVRNYNVGFTEPFVFGRPISAGVQLFSRKIQWIGAYTEDSAGGSVTLGKPLTLFTRLFLTYSYEATRVTDINPFFFSDTGSGPSFASANPFFADSLLVNSGGRRNVSKITPSLRLNTVDHPIFPNRGRNLSAGLELAGAGGNTKFYKPTLDGTWYFPHTSRTTLGLRAQWSHLAAGDPLQIPVFERLWLGGEYSVRGFDIRRIGPTVSDLDPLREPGSTPTDLVPCANPDPSLPSGVRCVGVDPNSFQGRTIMGGNKSLLFNAEYQFTIAGPVRLIAFYDAGQVQDFGRHFDLGDFKTSTGIELRFFMPMLNVPFRLIYSWNPQRDGVYNDNLQPQEARTFRFAVGTTF